MCSLICLATKSGRNLRHNDDWIWCSHHLKSVIPTFRIQLCKRFNEETFLRVSMRCARFIVVSVGADPMDSTYWGWIRLFCRTGSTGGYVGCDTSRKENEKKGQFIKGMRPYRWLEHMQWGVNEMNWEAEGEERLYQGDVSLSHCWTSINF